MSCRDLQSEERRAEDRLLEAIQWQLLQLGLQPLVDDFLAPSGTALWRRINAGIVSPNLMSKLSKPVMTRIP